jgi:hypothetical protein
VTAGYLAIGEEAVRGVHLGGWDSGAVNTLLGGSVEREESLGEGDVEAGARGRHFV